MASNFRHLLSCGTIVDSLHRMYPGYRYQMVPVIIGALGTIPAKLKMIGLTSKAINRFIEHGQKLACLGTLKIIKEFPEALKPVNLLILKLKNGL